MTAPNGADAPNPFAPLGLPPTWQPSPLRWRLGQIQAMTPDGPQALQVLIVDTAAGTFGFSFAGPEMRALADAILTHVSGIAIVRDLPD